MRYRVRALGIALSGYPFENGIESSSSIISFVLSL